MKRVKNIPIGTKLYMDSLMGKTIEQMAEEYSISNDEVKKLIDEDIKKRAGKISGPIGNKEVRKELAKEYLDGRSTVGLSKKYGVSGITIAKYVRENGIDIRNSSEAHRIYHPNETIFDEIDTEEKAYLLGFIWADGYNNEENSLIRMELQSGDKDMVLALAKFFYPEEYLEKVKETSDSNYFTVNSPKLSKRLSELGCHQAKSLNVKYPEWISENLEKHFIRGYFDGDGSISQSQGNYHLSFIGSYDFILHLKSRVLHLTKIDLGKISASSSVYVVAISGNNKIYDFANWMYSGSKIYLKRKYKRYQHIRPGGPLEPKLHDCNNVILGPDGFPLTPEYIWESKDRDSLVRFVVDYYTKNGFPYPKYLNDALDRQFELLCKYNAIEIKNTSPTGINICKHFCSKLFYSSKVKGSKSCVEIFENKNLLTRAVENRMGYCTDGSGRPFVYGINNNTIIRGMISSGLSMNVSHFKPTFAKSIIHRYLPNGGSMYDFCAGWGARLLAAESLGVKYIGIDPNSSKELNDMISYFGFKAVVTSNISESYIPDEKVDLCFSCPPYFDQEQYSEKLTQSYNAYKTLEEWIDKYWSKTVENCYNSLKPGGIFAYVIPVRLKTLMDRKCEMFRHIEDIGIESQYSHLSKRTGKKVTEFLVAWAK